MQRQIFASKETNYVATTSSAKFVKVYSFFPIDKSDCSCKQLILDWQKKLGSANDKERRTLLEKTAFLECPRDKTGLTRYQIVCSKCNDIQGYCYASTPDLLDWCDFHYVQWTKGTHWRGCFTPHVSPITEQLCFECCCGNDTRDFRANMTLPPIIALQHEARNRVGRKFNRSNSKFLVQLAK